MEGCTVEDRCLIGSGSVVLNRARVGARSVIGAQALVPENVDTPPSSMALGVPARVRPVDAETQRRWIDFAVAEYVGNGADYRRRLRRLEPDELAAASNLSNKENRDDQ